MKPEANSPAADTLKNSGRQSSKNRNKADDDGRKSVPFYRFFTFADSTDVLLMIVGTFAAICNGVSMPLMTVLYGQLVSQLGDDAKNNQMVHQISKVSLMFVFLGVGTGVAAFLQTSCWMITGERQSARIRYSYLKAILRQDISFFDKESNAGEVLGRMSGDTVLIQDAIGEKVGKFIQLLATFTGGFMIAFIKGWLLALVMLSSIILLVLCGAFTSKMISKMSMRGQTAYSEAGIVVEQTLSSIRTVVSFTGENQAVQKYDESLKTAYNASIQEGLAAGLGNGSLLFIVYCNYALALWFGSRMVQERGYSASDIIIVIFALFVGGTSLGQTSPCMSAFAAGKAAAYKIFETINRKPEIDAYESGEQKSDDICGYIELRDVHFHYPTRPNEQIFRGISLNIPSCTTTALVGASGSGKSTVISLIERFYDPQSGEVLIDGVDLKKYQLRWIREKIGLVSQEPVLFASSIRNNIAYGKDGATLDDIKSAATLANASKFIEKMPQGLDTMVGEHGTQLSGGQKQRIAIARAILKNPQILLLDEATSALDAESERVVQEALDKIMVNRTTIIVAHRLSTVRNVDTIVVIHQGTIVEKGSHSELLKDANSAYCQLIRLQDGIQTEGQPPSPNPDKPEITSDSRASQLLPFQQSISRGSPASVRNSNFHSPVSPISPIPHFGFPTPINIQDSSTTESIPPPLQTENDVPLLRLAYLNKPELPMLIIGSVAAIANGCVLPAFGLLFSGMVRTFYEPPDKLHRDTIFWCLMFIIFGFVALFASPAQTYFFSVVGAQLIRRIRSLCFKKVVHMEIGWFDEIDHSSGAIGAKLSTDAATVRSLVGDTLALIVQNLATIIAGLLIAFEANWQLSLIVLVLIPLLGFNGWVQMKFMQGFSADAKVMYEEATQVANEAVGSIRTVASFCSEERILELYSKKCEGPVKTGIRQGLISGIGFGFSFFLLNCVTATIFYAGAWLIEDGKITFDEIFRVIFALTSAAIGISQSSSLAPDATKAKASTASVFAILDRKSKIDTSDDSGMILDTVRGVIEFQHVSFKYPSRPDIQIFRDLCLLIQSGKTVALVGESGCGKSTAIALLQRFYDPDSGQIFLDGVEIQKIQLRWLRQQMGLVSQEPTLFNDTIRANIAYGKEGEATEAEILLAAESANAHKFISGLQQGYDTWVGEKGVQLSGGQKQRVAIARAIVKEPKILLLDEATSALDSESEKVVQEALDQVTENQTTLVVAHRLSTIKGADLIAVIKNGIIIEKGKHENLINIKNGVYASLVALHMCVSS